MKFNPDIHHRNSIRLKNYDYSKTGFYFVTVCCQDKICRFGKIENDEMVLNDVGKIAYSEWMKLPARFPNVLLHEFIVMPNHFHGIIEICRDADLSRPIDVCDVDLSRPIDACEIRRGVDLSRPDNKNMPDNKNIPDTKKGVINHAPTGGFAGKNNPMFHENLARIMRWFKGRTTFECRKIQSNSTCFAWQRNYYEHIIRDEQSYQKISNYIIHNPLNWKNDDLYTV
jgi:REP element-mobilizing transposase RayT